MNSKLKNVIGSNGLANKTTGNESYYELCSIMEVRMRQAEARAKMAEDRANRLEQENNAMKAKLEKQKPRVRRVCNIVRSKLKKEEYACRMGQK